MSTLIKVPKLGESIVEVEIVEWRKQPGDAVEEDETIAILDTQKTTVELPAPSAGTLTKVLKQSGETASVGEVIGEIEAGKPVAKKQEPKPPQPEAPEPKPQEPPKPAPKVMPAAERALAERGLRAEEVKPTGPGVRLLKEDVLQHTPEQPPAQPPPPRQSERPEEVVPMSALRRHLAKRLVEAQQTAALLTTFNEIDMSAVMSLRHEHQEAFQKKHNIKLGFMSFFIKAAIDALKTIPQLNAEIRGAEIAYRNYYDIGVAIGSGRGLVVPVLRNAERMSFAEIEKGIAEFSKRAQENALTIEELQGGTFTITNGGIYGSLLSTPIVNPPQSGILGMHAIQDRPVARNGQVVIRPMMYVALTYDHRIVDGREAVTFLKRIKDAIEQPVRMLIEA